MSDFESFSGEYGVSPSPNFVWDPILCEYVDPDLVAIDIEKPVGQAIELLREDQFPPPLVDDPEAY